MRSTAAAEGRDAREPYVAEGKTGMAQILVIEDERTLRALMRALLAHAGHEVIVIDNGIDGSDIAAMHRVDLVICDLMMEALDGAETIRRIRAAQPEAPVLIVSGLVPSNEAGARAIARRLGADRALAKPFRPNELTIAVAELLAAADTERQRRPRPTT
jgi:DNA-binding response OmpR family regulator